MKKFTAILLAVCILFAFSACDGKPQNTDATTEEYVLPTPIVTSDISLPYTSAAGFNPFTTKSALNRDLLPVVFESLYLPTDSGEGEPLLAASGEVDGKSVMVKLKQGVKFSDGSDFVSSHVKASFEKARNSAFFEAALSNVSSITLHDNYTVEFTLYGIDDMALNVLNFPITKLVDGEYIGTGKYKFEHLSKAPYLQVNEYHRDYSEKWNTQIALYDMAGVTSPIYPFKANKISLYKNDLSSEEYINLSSKTASIGLNNLVYVGVNSEWAGTLTSIDWVRQAVNIGIDRNSIAAASFLGQSNATATPFKKDFYKLENVELIGAEGNLEKAIGILERHGYDEFNSDGVRTNGSTALRADILVCTKNPYKLAVAESFKAQLERLGFGVSIREYKTKKNFVAALETGHYSFYIGEVQLTDNCDLSEFFSQSGSLNHGISEDMYEIYSAYKSGKDTVKVFTENFTARIPFLPLFYREAVVSLNPNITGESDGKYLYSSVSDWKIQ